MKNSAKIRVSSSDRGIANQIASTPKINGKIKANEIGKISPRKSESALDAPRFSAD